MGEKLKLIITSFIIFFIKPTLQNRTIQKFCESGVPEVINETATGKGEIKVDSVSMARSWLIHVNEEDNHGIDLNFKNFLLEDFFLVIRDGSSDSKSESMIQFVSGRSDKNLLFRIPFGKSLYMEICPEYDTSQDVIRGDFCMSFKRTVFEDTLPEEKPEVQIEKESYELQFKGKSPEEFKDSKFIIQFKEVVKKLAREYCKDSNIDFDEEKPAYEMVTILAIRYCPAEWHDRHICASIRHSVYVTHEHEVPAAVSNYELRGKHLQEMWGKVNDSSLEDLGLAIYKFPNKDEVLGWWFLLIVVPSIIIILATIYVRKIFSYVKENKQMKDSGGTKSIANTSRRRSKLKPNKHQIVPSFIKNQNKRSYLNKHQNLDNIDDQYVEQQSYMASFIFTKLPRRYEGYNNNVYN